MQSIKILQTICMNKKIFISTAESCTGGALAQAITSEPGASKIFNEGFIVYSNNAKIKNLSVSPKTLQNYGAVSEEVAIEMAINCQNITNSTVSVSITGIAGPGGSENKPEGRVCFGVTFNKKIISKTIEFGVIGRENVRIKSVEYALKLLINTLTE
ncbi:CinA family protein [Paracoccaceae bacterium]|jgi:nicotinamide-nucleotide amidase|nr:CinA family protein [Paracoccaceae bacterium]